MSRGRDAATRLERELVAMARGAGLAVAIDNVRSVPWASALFVGEQVQLSLCGPDTAWFVAWMDALPKAEFVLRGHLVADIAVALADVTGNDRRGDVLALLIEDHADGAS